MEKSITKTLLAALWTFASLFASAQCTILNRIASDGSMRYYLEPFNLYYTEAKSLKACIVTDRESFFIELQPVPFPAKPAGNKLKDDLTLKLANGETLVLEHFDTRYVRNDSIMKMMYLIDKQDVEKLASSEIEKFSIGMGADEGTRTYTLKLHKGELKDQLNCLLQDAGRKKKK